MSKSVCMVIRHAPYGVIQAAEAVRHINGAVANGFVTTAIFTDNGVYVLKADQESENTPFTNLGDALSNALNKPEPRAAFYVHQASAEKRGLTEVDILPGVQWINDQDLAKLLTDSANVMLF